MTTAPCPADLRAFFAAAEAAGEPPIRVRRTVSTEHELGAVVKALETRDDRAIVFERVHGSDLPVAINVFGTPARIALALGMAQSSTPQQILAEFDTRLNTQGTGTTTAPAPAHAVVQRDDEVDLAVLPIGMFAAEQNRPYINSGVLIASDPRTGVHNAGIYRMMVLDQRHLTVSVDPGHDLGKLITYGRETGTEVRFSLVIGAAPTVHLASQAKNPLTRDFYDVLSALTGRPVEVADSLTNDVRVPASAKTVIEGAIIPGKTAAEGPYGEFSYYYGSDPQAPVCRVDVIARREDAIYQDIDPVHSEHRRLWLFPGREQNLLRRLREITPAVRDVALPDYGAGMVAYVRVENHHDGDPRRLLLAALASDMFIKHAVVVDDDIDIRDRDQIVWALTARFQPDRDIVIASGLRGYSEDPSGFYRGTTTSGGRLTSKIGYDATVPVGTPFPISAAAAPAGYENLNLQDYLQE